MIVWVGGFVGYFIVCLDLRNTVWRHSTKQGCCPDRPTALLTETHCFPNVFTHSMAQLSDLLWHSKLYLNYQFGSYTKPLASVCAAAICHSGMLGFSGLLSSGAESPSRGRGALVLTWLSCSVLLQKSVTELHWCIRWLPRKWKTGLRGLWEDTVAGN